MDLGIRGRKALLTGASRGLGKAAAIALARDGVDITILARTRDVLERTADEIRALGVKVTAVVGDVTTAGRTRGCACRLSRARHPDQQRRRLAARRLPQLHARRLACRARRHDARADRDDARDRRRHDGAQVRPHRQHLLAQRQDRAARKQPLERRAFGADRFRRRPVAPDRRAQRHDQQHPARHLRHRRAEAAHRGAGAGDRQVRSSKSGRSAPPAIRPGATGGRRSSAPIARSSARRRPASSPGRTC